MILNDMIEQKKCDSIVVYWKTKFEKA